MAVGLSALRKRLAKIERDLAQMETRKELAHCLCRKVTQALDPEEFEAEMNRTCPVHGVRRLGQLLIIRMINPDRSLAPESVKLHQLVDKYKCRLSQTLKSGRKVEHDS